MFELQRRRHALGTTLDSIKDSFRPDSSSTWATATASPASDATPTHAPSSTHPPRAAHTTRTESELDGAAHTNIRHHQRQYKYRHQHEYQFGLVFHLAHRPHQRVSGR